MSTKYSVMVERFAERHFIKKFKKKYKKAWDITWEAINEELKRVDSLFETSIAEKIVKTKNIRIVKTKFRVVGTNQSKNASGDRCIVAVQEDIKMVYVLLVYHKNDLGNGNETVRWKQMVKKNYSQYKDLF
jgi:hypothetical protein